MKLRNTYLIAPLAAAALALAGCAPVANDTLTDAPSAQSESFNASDVSFAQMMIPHHQQAIDMADVVLDKSDIDPRVIDLAERVKQAQGPEIEQLKEMLDRWGADEDAGMPGMDHGEGGMGDGMMSDSDMEALAAASGEDASRLFLEQMIVHHRGAIEMAEMEVDSGADPEAIRMAQTIIDAQESEIAEMQEILSAR